jgi:hypothetical protein
VRREVDLAVDVGGAADRVVRAGAAAVDGGLVLGQELLQSPALPTDLALLDEVGNQALEPML